MVDISIRNFFSKELLIFIALSIFIINFFDLNKFWNYLIIVVVFVLIFQKDTFLFDLDLLCLFSFSLLYSYFIARYDAQFNVFEGIRYTFIPSSTYLIGKYLSIKYPFIKITYSVIFFTIITFSIVPFLSNIISAVNLGFMSTREIKSIWNSSEIVSATIAGSHFALNIVLFPLILIKSKEKFEKKLKYFCVILFVMGLFSYTNMMTRTGMFILFISLLITILFLEPRQKIRYSIILILSVIPLIIVLYYFGTIKWFEHTDYYFRFYGEVKKQGEVPRFPNWQRAFYGLFEYPLGGCKTRLTSHYAHNLWLDVGWKAGVFPLFALIIFTIRYFITIYKITMNNYYPAFFRSLIICISAGFILSFSVEPVLEGMFINFCIFCMFFGLFNPMSKIKFV